MHLFFIIFANANANLLPPEAYQERCPLGTIYSSYTSSCMPAFCESSDECGKEKDCTKISHCMVKDSPGDFAISLCDRNKCKMGSCKTHKVCIKKREKQNKKKETSEHLLNKSGKECTTVNPGYMTWFWGVIVLWRRKTTAL